MARFVWNSATSRYETADGRTVRDDRIRSALDLVIDAQALVMRMHTQALVDGTLSLAAWTTYMMLAVKQTHLVALAVASGGWANLDQTDFGWAGQRVRDQYRYLVTFSVEISSGTQKLDGTVLARSALYAQAARETHREAQRRLVRARIIAGEERRVLAPADHCRDCLAQAKLGWQPFGTLKRIGDSACRSNCRCHFDFRAAA